MVYTDDYSREGIVKAMKLRHTYGATDNIIADFRSKAADGSDKMMGDEFSVKGAPSFDIHFTGTTQSRKSLSSKTTSRFPSK